MNISDLSFERSFTKKAEAQKFADGLRGQYRYVRVVKSSVSSNSHRDTKLVFYRVYVG